MIYKIDHYYSLNHDENCVMIESNIDIDSMIGILASIHFAFENLVDEGISIDERHFLEILEEFYKVKDVKKEYKKYLPFTKLKDSDWEIINIFNLKILNTKITQIDLYGAREFCCGPQYKELMKTYLPKNKKLIKLEEKIKGYKEYYKDYI